MLSKSRHWRGPRNYFCLVKVIIYRKPLQFNMTNRNHADIFYSNLLTSSAGNLNVHECHKSTFKVGSLPFLCNVSLQ